MVMSVMNMGLSEFWISSRIFWYVARSVTPLWNTGAPWKSLMSRNWSKPSCGYTLSRFQLDAMLGWMAAVP